MKEYRKWRPSWTFLKKTSDLSSFLLFSSDTVECIHTFLLKKGWRDEIYFEEMNQQSNLGYFLYFFKVLKIFERTRFYLIFDINI